MIRHITSISRERRKSAPKYKDAEDSTIPFDLLQEVGLIFCMTDLEVIDMLRLLSEKYSASMAYSDVAGIRQLQITQQIDPKVLIDQYYE